MSNFARSPWVLVVGFFFLLAPTVAFAQGISGEVTDNTGGVLPGVTVAAASPALIEGERIAITDSQGLYTIIDLRPGLYTVTFTLPGFTTVVREGVELSTGVTANIDSAMSVGGIEETITVTGATPVVDVQNVRRQTAVTDEVLSTLPMSTKHVNNLVTLTPGFTGLADVGGRYSSQVGGSFHGKRGTKVAFDGMGVENTSGNSSYQINAAAVEEMVLQTSGIGADTNADGPVVNIVPKEGSNQFSGILAGFYSGAGMESENLTADLQSRGVTTSNSTLKLWDQSLSLGGPVAAGPGVVLRGRAELGLLAEARRRLLEPEHRPGCAGDGAGPVSDAGRSRPQGRAVHPVEWTGRTTASAAGSSGTTRT